jgi:hypothetical protein
MCKAGETNHAIIDLANMLKIEELFYASTFDLKEESV